MYPGLCSVTLLGSRKFLLSIALLFNKVKSIYSYVTWICDFCWQTAANKSLWPEYEISNEDECEFDEPMSNGDGSSNSLVSRSRTEGSYGEMVEYFKVIFFFFFLLI